MFILLFARSTSNDAIELLFNSVDDRTLEKLESVADRLTDKQKQDPDTFMPIFEQAMYPKQCATGNPVPVPVDPVIFFRSGSGINVCLLVHT